MGASQPEAAINRAGQTPDPDQQQDPGMPEHSAGIRIGKELVQATRPFAQESAARSWGYVISTFILMIAALVGAGVAPWWPLRLALSILGALVMVRAFITYHDYMHGAILRDSRMAEWLFRLYAGFALTPASSWKKSHNYHHGHVGRISAASVGAFPLMTTRMWHDASSAQRFSYRFQRHPLVVLFGYVTVFFFSITLMPLITAPVEHKDSAWALMIHGGLIAVLWLSGGFDVALFSVILPVVIASALGSYLFFAQHSFKRMHVMSPEAWTFYRAALESSSYMRLGKLMQWFTGNIGYHHIHHLNVRIPFYRLPEAMAAIPELQSPLNTSLAPRDIVDCFQASLWDEDRQRMVSYREAGKR
jgi:omega-6 fatty acid desaturase (delta-12 desaturase)